MSELIPLSALAGQRRRIIGALLGLSLLASTVHGLAHAGVPFSAGDLVIGLGSSPDGSSQGALRHFSPSGTLFGTLFTASGSFEETGACFDATSKLYTTNFESDSVSTFDPDGALRQPSFGVGFNDHPNSCLVDAAGNVYVGLSDRDGSVGGGGLLKLDQTGTVLDRFNPAPDRRGTDWIDLAADQCTLFYTSVGSSIKRFDLCRNLQLPDFCTRCDDGAGEATPGPLFALRLLGDGSVLVADWNGHLGSGMVRRYDAAGVQIGAYFVGDVLGYECGAARNRPCFFPWALGLDPDRVSVWVADHVSGEIFRFDLMSGVLLGQFAGGHCDDFLRPCAVTGMAVVGEPTAALAAAATVTPAIADELAARSNIDR